MLLRRSSYLCILLLAIAIAGCAPESSSSGTTLVGAAVQRAQIMADLEQTAVRFYEMVEKNKPEQAKAELNVLNRLVPKQNFDGITTVEGMEALTKAINEANRALNSVSYDSRKAMLTAAKVRLAVDALNRERRPMWMEFEHTFRNEVNQLEQALTAKDEEAFRKTLGETTAHYDMIRPALVISGKIVDTEAIDSLITVIGQAAGETIDYVKMPQLIEHYSVLINQLFKSDTSTIVLPADGGQEFFWTLVIGAIVITVLSYVAWRRFQYEQYHVTTVGKHRRFEP